MPIITSKKNRTINNVDEFHAHLTKFSHAGIGVFVIRTREYKRCADAIHLWAIKESEKSTKALAEDEDNNDALVHDVMDFKVWNIRKGWGNFPRVGEVAVDRQGHVHELHLGRPKEWTPEIDLNKALGSIEKFTPGVFVMLHCHHAFAIPGVQQFIKDHVQDALCARKYVIFVVPEDAEIPPAIEPDVHIIDFKTPSHLELRNLWEETIGLIEDNIFDHFTEEDVDLIIQNSIGMSALEFTNSLAIAIVELCANTKGGKTKLKKLSSTDIINVIMRTKTEVVKKTEILELMPRASMEEIGGLGALKEWLSIRKCAFTEEAREYGVDQPKGMLVCGPPGTGKSLFAKAASAVFGIPCIKFDVGKVFGKYVGESEEKMRRALKIVESISPCVLLIDEVDKGLSGAGGGGDNGVTSRVFGTLLTWMQERNSDNTPVFVIMTANNVLNLPPELMRRGRIDEIFAVTFPNERERKTILKIHVEKRGHELSDDEYDSILPYTVDFVGAELEAIVKDGITMAFHKGNERVSAQDIIQQAREIIPLSKAFEDKVKAMNTWAENNARPASYLEDAEPRDKNYSRGLRKLRIKSSSTFSD